jgi:hypothetical protein
VHSGREAIRTTLIQVNPMLTEMTRSRLLQLWFAAVALIVLASLALGASMTFGTAAILLALCLVPPAIVLKLWPGKQSQTANDVLHGIERR